MTAPHPHDVPNPPAFPVVIPDGCGGFHFADNGMTLRDWFAGQALSGLLASYAAHGPIMQSDPTAIAIACAQYADAMLAARTLLSPERQLGEGE